MSQKAETALPLAGIKVLEFTQLIMGPTAGLILADFGADVIKVEAAPDGEPTRGLKGFAAGFYPHFNRNKRSLAIDLKSNTGRDLALRLCAQSDVVIENFAPGTMERLGCGADVLCALNPALIYCSLKGFLDGPYAHRTALDEVVQFMGALAFMTGPAGRPLRAGTSVIDLMGGTMAVVAILAALRERDKTGLGQVVKAGLFETTAFMMGQHMAGSVVTGERLEPMPEKRGGWCIYEPFKTSSGDDVFIAVTSNKHWKEFCRVFGLDDLAADPRLETNDQRVEARPWMLPIVIKAIASRSKADVLKLCDEANIPFAPVAKVEDLFDDPHLNQSGALLDMRIDGKPAKLPKLPVKLSRHELGLQRNAPAAGEHSREILTRLGLGAEEIDRLEANGIVRGDRKK